MSKEMNTVPDYLKPHVLNYDFIIKPKKDKDGFVIKFTDLTGCMSDGLTIEETIINGQDALRSYIISSKEFGDDIPKISGHSDEKFSGIIDDFINEKVCFSRGLIHKACLEKSSKIMDDFINEKGCFSK